MHYVYVLHSERDAGLFIGCCADLRTRMREHRQGRCQGTAHRLPLRLAYYEAYLCREDAEGRERFLRSGPGRRFLRCQLRHFFERFAARPPTSNATAGPGCARHSTVATGAGLTAAASA